MTFTIAGAITLLLIMVVFIYFLLKREVSDINNKSKVYFTRKAQEYTDSIIRQKETTESNDTVVNEEKEDKVEENENSKPSVIYVEKKANYEINDLLKLMKQVEDSFSLNDEATIKTFIKNYAVDDEDQIMRYNDLKSMQEYVNKVGVYNIVISDDEDFLEAIVNDLRLINEDVFMEFYSGLDVFQVEDFCNFLDYEMGKCDPTIYIYVGNDKTNYNAIDKRIKTIYSEDIYKGMKIVYLNKMYDYSLS